MTAGDAQLARGDERRPPVAIGEDQAPVGVKKAAVARMQRQRKAADHRRRAGVDRRRGGIVEVEYRDVARALPGNDVALRRDVVLTRAVMVQVIFADVRDDRDMRTARERLELERGELEHDDVVLRDRVELLDDRASDVAPDDHAPATAREDLTDQRGRGGLSFGARHADDRRRAQPEEQTDLGQHGDLPLQRAEDRR